MSDDRDELPDDLRALLKAAPRPVPSPEASARMLAAVAAQLAAPPPGGGSGGSGGAGAGGAAATAKLVWLGVGLVAGAVAGGAIGYGLGRTSVEVHAAAPTPAPPPPRAQPPAATITEERALLDAAHATLSAGDAEAALAQLGRHAEAFPHGQLAEEREALRVRALFAAHRAADARQALEAFDRTYPGSLFSQGLHANQP